jgi:hypothetical protein
MTRDGMGLLECTVACAGNESHRIKGDGNTDGAFFHDGYFVRN